MYFLIQEGIRALKRQKNDQKRQIHIEITKNGEKGGCAAKCTFYVLKNKGFGGSPYVYLKVLPVPYLQIRGVRRRLRSVRHARLGGRFRGRYKFQRAT